ncbi:MAG: signal recognition particle protein [Candidatus Sumerlaeales bacterium]|nr:signal recognition particle protein [Candidatus Sumerlaeales bacterium]
MFESLSERLEGAFKRLRGQGQITESNVREALRDVRMALLDADVNFKVVKDFMARVQEKALGQDVLTSVSPGQQLVKIVNDELVEILGGASMPFELKKGEVNVILMLGLQGSGKTTFCGKLAKRFIKEGNKPLLVACDIHRPAAVAQLQTVGAQVGAQVYAREQGIDAARIAAEALRKANDEGYNILIVDTAGRLHIDEVKMDELLDIKNSVKPSYTFLVADSMTGQDAINSATVFNEKIGIDGVCLTKMDGDARGGAALSIRSITGKPVKFIGTGEKFEDLMEFHAERMASRILGMGDVVTLVEKAQEAFDEKQSQKLINKMMNATFTLQDFLEQMQQVRRMGPLGDLLKLIPGMGNMMKDINIPEEDMRRTESIILSMSKKERDNPSLLNASRRERIAKGCGRTVADVNALVTQFEQTRKAMASFSKMGQAMKGREAGTMSSMTGAMMGDNKKQRLADRKKFEKRMKLQQRKKNRQKKK